MEEGTRRNSAFNKYDNYNLGIRNDTNDIRYSDRRDRGQYKRNRPQ